MISRSVLFAFLIVATLYSAVSSAVLEDKQCVKIKELLFSNAGQDTPNTIEALNGLLQQAVNGLAHQGQEVSFQHEFHVEFFKHFEMDAETWKTALYWAENLRLDDGAIAISIFVWEQTPALGHLQNFYLLANYIYYHFEGQQRTKMQHAIAQSIHALYSFEVSADKVDTKNNRSGNIKLEDIRSVLLKDRISHLKQMASTLGSSITWWIAVSPELQRVLIDRFTLWVNRKISELQKAQESSIKILQRSIDEFEELSRALNDIKRQESDLSVAQFLLDNSQQDDAFTQSNQSTHAILASIQYHKCQSYLQMLSDLKMTVVPLQGTLEDLKVNQLKVLQLHRIWEELRREELVGPEAFTKVQDIVETLTNNLKVHYPPLNDQYYQKISDKALFGMFIQYFLDNPIRPRSLSFTEYLNGKLASDSNYIDGLEGPPPAPKKQSTSSASGGGKGGWSFFGYTS